MYLKLLFYSLAILLWLSSSAIAQRTISLSELKKSKTPQSKAVNNKPNEPAAAKIETKETVKFSKFEDEVFEEVNTVRKNPSMYVEYLQEYKKLIRGGVLYRPNQMPFKMNEGISAIDNAISDLQNATALRPLTASKLLTVVANNQLSDLKENPNLGHYGKDGSDLRKRLAKVGKTGKMASENINYRDRIARQTVLTMIIDDGVKSRTHRKNILNPEYNMLGVSCGIAKGDLMICVLVFADKFDEINPSTKPVPVEVL